MRGFFMEKIIHIMNDKNVKYFDDEINTPALKTIKAIVPYIDSKYQKKIAIMIKIFEIQMLNELYNKQENAPNKFDIESAIINVMKIYMNDEIFDTINQAINIVSKKNEGNDTDMHDIFNDPAFSNLSDKDKNLIENFMRDIDQKSPIDAINIMMDYNKKINISNEQKTAMINTLLKKVSPQKRQQFLTLYNMFAKN